MVFLYNGFTVLRLGLYRYLIQGHGFRGYTATENEALKIIDGIIAGQC